MGRSSSYLNCGLLPLRRAVLALMVCGLTACASVPPEAPELSAYLGSRINAMEAAHRSLLGRFFDERKRQLDDFMAREWLPVFADELFKDPAIARVWDQVVRSTDQTDRVQFLVRLGPRVQQQLNAKRQELVRPLEELESTIAARLRTDYDEMRSINGTLTAFLQSASKVEQNRRRFLDMVGIKESEFDEVIYETDKAVSTLLRGAQTVQGKVNDATAFVKRIEEQISKLRARRKGG